MSAKLRRVAPRVAAPAVIPAFDPADFALPPRDGWTDRAVVVAANMYVRAHGLDGPPWQAARHVASAWLAAHHPAPF